MSLNSLAFSIQLYGFHVNVQRRLLFICYILLFAMLWKNLTFLIVNEIDMWICKVKTVEGKSWKTTLIHIYSVVSMLCTSEVVIEKINRPLNFWTGAYAENKRKMQVMPSDDFSDDVIHITSTTPINRDSTPLIQNQPRKWLFFCRLVIIYVASQWIAMHIDWMHFQLFIQYEFQRVFHRCNAQVCLTVYTYVVLHKLNCNVCK